ncbi:MAG: tetratricopeptide repeat protein [Alphaproteobacteria bacterium]|nr:tetratricopeptide repeat protein [Alphaproteobacteria bacterium]
MLRARDLYKEGNFEESLKENERIAEAGDPQGLRFQGLCLYRMDRYAESEAKLREALAKVSECLKPYVLNHLGATVRRLGRFREAEQIFRDGLELASKDLEARARLLGNLGALYDELERPELAIDHYARFEELARIGGHPDRLANALGLVARRAARYGDFERAQSKGEEELRLARENGLRSVESSALRHLGDVASKQGDLVKARALFHEALEVAKRHNLRRRIFTMHHCLGRLETDAQRLALALGHLEAALKVAKGPDPLLEMKARVALARWASAAHLHGDALHHLRRAVETFQPLVDQHAELLKVRKQKADELNATLLREALRVTRSPHELKELDALMPDWREHDEAAAEPHWRWQERAVAEAEEVWRLRLGDARWDGLEAESRKDLLRTHEAYQGATDLGAVMLGLARVVERELRERVDEPRKKPRRGQKEGDWKSLGDLIQADDRARLTFKDLTAVDSERINFANLRNRIAHGNPYTITRLQVDAVIRALCFGPNAVL